MFVYSNEIGWMKTFLTIITLSLSTMLTAQDSVVDYFAANPRWVETFVGPDASETPVEVQFYLEGDSTINGKTYHKLMANSVSIPSVDIRAGKRLQGLIRQEGRKIFYRGFVLIRSPHNGGTPILNNTPLPKNEVLLYDFGLQKGDTLNVKNNPLFYDHTLRFPDDTAYVFLNENPGIYNIYPNYYCRNIRFVAQNGNAFNILEGMGSIDFFLGSITYNSYINCYTNDSAITGEINMPNNSSTDCDFVTSIEKVESKNTAIFFPQPSQGMLYFSGIEVQSYSLYSGTGQLLITKENANATQELNMSHWPDGLYFLHYSTRNGQQGVEKVLLNRY